MSELKKTRLDLYSPGFAMNKAKEIFDHGFKQPSVALSAAMKHEVQLSTTSLSRISRALAYKQACDSDNVSVMQTFQGDYSGALLLLINVHRYTEMMSRDVNNLLSIDGMVEIDSDTLCELGNIVLNGMLRTASILIGSRLNCAHPSRPSLECMKRKFSSTGVYQSDVFIIDIGCSWLENDNNYFMPFSMQLHLENNEQLLAWENMASQSFDADRDT